ncbi:hypothetical protein [Sphingomonas koreensis]
MTESSKTADVAAGGNLAYRVGVALAALTSFLIVWTTIVRDSVDSAGFFLLVMAPVVGGFAARFRPAGMARTMLGVAVMQFVWSLAVATAPMTAQVSDGVFKTWLFGGFFTMSWLVSAAFFRTAAKGDREAVAAH